MLLVILNLMSVRLRLIAKNSLIIRQNQVSSRSIVAWVVDWCQCREGKNEKLVDLSPEAWRAVAGPDTPLSRGVLKVKVEVIP